MTLDDLMPDQTAVIKAIPPDLPSGRRLRDLGFVQSSKIRALFINPMGSATAFQIRGSVIALRKEDAKNIEAEVDFLEIK